MKLIITSISAFLGLGLLKYKRITPKQWILVKSFLTG